MSYLSNFHSEEELAKALLDKISKRTKNINKAEHMQKKISCLNEKYRNLREDNKALIKILQNCVLTSDQAKDLVEVLRRRVYKELENK